MNTARPNLLPVATCVLALATLILASAMGMSRAGIAFGGAKVDIYAPDEVIIYFDRATNLLGSTRVLGEVSLTSAGDPGFSRIVRNVRVEVTLGNLHFTEAWLNIVRVNRVGTQLQVQSDSATHPVVLAGGGAFSGQAAFAPKEHVCDADHAKGCDGLANFIDSVHFLNAAAAARTMTLSFRAEIVGTSRIAQSDCHLTLTGSQLVALAEVGWFAATCQQV